MNCPSHNLAKVGYLRYFPFSTASLSLVMTTSLSVSLIPLIVPRSGLLLASLFHAAMPKQEPVPAGRERTVSDSTGQALRRFAPTTMRSSSPPVRAPWKTRSLAMGRSPTLTCGANTQPRRARNPGGWICLANSSGYLSSFETNVCWRAYLKGKSHISDELVFQTPQGTISRS